MRLFLCGDVMTGRGIDQIMAHPGDPQLHEPYVRSALDYVALAETRLGKIPRNVEPGYIWGDALVEIARRRPDLRIINLETSVTAGGFPEPKGINYRMHPANIGCLAAAGIDCCVLANNHVADWGEESLTDTLDGLHNQGLATTGAGREIEAARRPANLAAPNGRRVLVFAYACPSSGVPVHWAARADRPGVNLLPHLDKEAVAQVAGTIGRWRRSNDLTVVSIHWGPNWGYSVPDEHRDFAHALVEEAGVDVVHGHSSHHPLGIEVHHGKPIFYGCGDFINDYEGIAGHEGYRPDLALAYFVEIDDGNASTRSIEMVPFRMAKFRLHRASRDDATWLGRTLDRESRRFKTRVEDCGEGALTIRPSRQPLREPVKH